MLHPKHKVHVLRSLISDLHKMPHAKAHDDEGHPNAMDDTPGFEDQEEASGAHDVEGQGHDMHEAAKMAGLHKDNAFGNAPLHNEEPTESSVEEASEYGKPKAPAHVESKVLHGGSKLGGVPKGLGNPEIHSKYQGPHGGQHGLPDSSLKLKKPVKKVTY